LKFTLLGTGTSQGIPVIGCNCAVCTSNDPRDNRRRCSAIIEDKDISIVIDVGPDFRQQMLDHGVQNVDAVLITHEHNDHVIGLDDLRPLIFKRREAMTIYAEMRVLVEIKERFKYAFETHAYPGAPEFKLIEIKPGDTIRIQNVTIDVLRVMHGQLPILGFVINKQLAYLTDTKTIPEEAIEQIRGVDVLMMDMLRQKPHHSHSSFEEAVDNAKKIKAKATYMIHMSHLMGPTEDWEQKLPADVYPSYDGLQFDLDEL